MLELASGVEGVLRHDYFQLLCMYKKALMLLQYFTCIERMHCHFAWLFTANLASLLMFLD